MPGSDKHVKGAGLSDAVKKGSEQASGDSAESVSRVGNHAVGSDDPTCLSLSIGVMVSRNNQVPLGWNSNMLVGPDNSKQSLKTVR